MFVGDSGIGHIVRRTVERIRRRSARVGSSICRPPVDLLGADISSNAASYFAAGLKGRADESLDDDHVAAGQHALDVPDARNGVRTETVSMRNAMNEVIRTAYIRDCENGVKRWNKILLDRATGPGYQQSARGLRVRASGVVSFRAPQSARNLGGSRTAARIPHRLRGWE